MWFIQEKINGWMHRPTQDKEEVLESVGPSGGLYTTHEKLCHISVTRGSFGDKFVNGCIFLFDVK